MDLSILVSIILWPHLLSAFGLRALTAPSSSSVDDYKLSRTSVDEFDPVQILEPPTRKPEIYAQAIAELKRLEEEPLCHRTATQLLLNNCHGLQDISQADYQLHSSRMQRHHVESLAATLAICDMELRFEIPEACTAFRMPALLEAAETGRGGFNVTSGQVGNCLRALGKDHSHWNTWLSYRDTALLLCQAFRLDIEKDQTILLHRRMLDIMTAFSEGLREDVRNLRQSMARNAKDANTYVEGIRTHLSGLKAIVQGTLQGFNAEIMETGNVVKDILRNAFDVQRILKSIIDTAIQGNAHMAAEQEQVLSVTTDSIQSYLSSITSMSEGTEDSLLRLQDRVNTLLPTLVSIAERQQALDQRFDALAERMYNMTVTLQKHSDSLQNATSTATHLQTILQITIAAAESMSTSLGQTSRLIDWAVRISTPFISVFLGNYKVTPSLQQNAFLIVSGWMAGETIVQVRHWEYFWGARAQAQVTEMKEVVSYPGPVNLSLKGEAPTVLVQHDGGQ